VQRALQKRSKGTSSQETFNMERPNLAQFLEAIPKDDKSEKLMLKLQSLDVAFGVATKALVSGVQGNGFDSADFMKSYKVLVTEIFNFHYQANLGIIQEAEKADEEEAKHTLYKFILNPTVCLLLIGEYE